ncbi:MAG: DUF4258 domain-containing protein [Oscillochloris sp.]|nr:DUF4258 domain-containing protein [Oscillochloris sp.]
MAQRNLTTDDVAFVLEHGYKEYRAGVVAYVLGWRQLARLEDTRNVDRLEGSVILRNPQTGEVVTVYRNRCRGLKDHRRKSKYDRHG